MNDYLVEIFKTQLINKIGNFMCILMLTGSALTVFGIYLGFIIWGNQ